MVSRKPSPITEGLPSADTQRLVLSGFPGVIAAQRFDLVPKRAADNSVEEIGQSRMGLQIGFGDHEIVPSGLKRHKIETE